MPFLKDLSPVEEMAPTVGMLFSAVNENIERLKSIVSGISQEELEYKGEHGDKNCIAQLIYHLINVDIRWVYRLKESEFPRELEEKYGPMTDENGRLPEVKGVPLTVLIEWYEEVLEMLKHTAKGFSEKDLLKKVPYEGGFATIRWGIWHLSDHNRYHQAHIQACLREFRRQNS
ncbi:DinB family protein [Bacillus haynesii]|uniref:DinB family protein n=2 Tax=Bacillus haynesii TaxID=1925021 RepID=A0AA90F729_9BACI|nr:DinB family protein [Bacillus haynesii]MCY7754183.1 DinB family protein [Bacillus haynesii]MCY7791785.1 DinB family protein [Bacillus haynesii]MCY7860972.1 DinB family protein [Bacillus haynesii]MCY7914463.1 DinB family protein [Bacillus haynesii]MCY7924940.1 DinB family protein [Bacillus haynesii]